LETSTATERLSGEIWQVWTSAACAAPHDASRIKAIHALRMLKSPIVRAISGVSRAGRTFGSRAAFLAAGPIPIDVAFAAGREPERQYQ
jgi:hypothetical protein